MTPPSEYKNPVPTVDIIIELNSHAPPGAWHHQNREIGSLSGESHFHTEDDRIVLIRRKNPPFGWALPGGFVDYGESLEAAAIREAEEETGLKVRLVRQLHTYSSPDRDPRQHNITTVFIARAEGSPRAADDAADIGLFNQGNLPQPLAFDHHLILDDYFNQKKNIGLKRPAKEIEKNIHQVRDLLKDRIPADTRIGIVLGTGLGDLAQSLEQSSFFSYQDLPFFPHSTVESHQGKLIWGRISGKNVLVLQGRFHLYEGYSAQEIAFPIRVLAALGIRVLILSNAAGGLDPLFNPGDIMLITDQINFTGENPLIGSHLESWGPRFPDMTQVYDPRLCALAREAAGERKIPLVSGVYIGLKGPSLETPAETRLLISLGAQAVGMSTIMESITAVQAGMRILGFSVITNVNDPAKMKPVSMESVIETAQKAEPKLRILVEGVISRVTSKIR